MAGCHAEPFADACANPNAFANPDAFSNPNAYPNAYAYTYANPDAFADSDAYANSDAYVNSDAYPHSDTQPVSHAFNGDDAERRAAEHCDSARGSDHHCADHADHRGAQEERLISFTSPADVREAYFFALPA